MGVKIFQKIKNNRKKNRVYVVLESFFTKLRNRKEI